MYETWMISQLVLYAIVNTFWVPNKKKSFTKKKKKKLNDIIINSNLIGFESILQRIWSLSM